MAPPRVEVLLAAGFEEIETATIVDVLRRACVTVVLAGLDGPAPCPGSRDIVFVPDKAFDPADLDYDLVVLPGGLAGTRRLAAHEGLKSLLRQRVASGKPVAAICAAPWALDAAGVLSEGAFTCFPGVEARLSVGGRRDETVVDAGTVITSQGPATAMPFALHLVERLVGQLKRAQVAEALLTRER
jgi:protein deglycase